MNIYQNLYFMSLAGAVAGLFAWASQALVVSLIPAGSPAWLTAVIAAALLGVFIGGFTVAFDDKWGGNRLQIRRVAVGALIGLAAGVLSGTLHLPLREALPEALPLGSTLGWMLTGALIGAGLGARKDEVAIVPFASRDVEKTITSTHFANTRAQAQAELDALLRPEARNNTALYSAVRDAVAILQRHRRGDGEPPRLIVLTDGTNDVHPQKGDDEGLLAGQNGLNEVTSVVQHSGVDVLPIGLGDKHSIDEAAMTRLGTRPPLITLNLDALHEAFQLRRMPEDGGMTVTIQAPEHLASRTLLAGRIVHFRIKVTLSDGTALVENRQALWVAPPVATPAFEGVATQAEQRAFLADARDDHSSMMFFLRPLFIFVGLGAVLALLWFAFPRLLWPERYDSRSARPIRPEYWPGAEQFIHRTDNHSAHKQAPPGFEMAGRGMRAAARSPGEHTIVRPITGFDPNKTRLS